MRVPGLTASSLVAVASLAAADPPAAKPAPPITVELPDVVAEAQRNTLPGGDSRLFGQKHGMIGIDGEVSAGIIVDPGLHPDARPHPYGILIHPTDPNDPMALEMGTSQLRNRVPRAAPTPWLPRDLSLGIGRGADKVWELVLPKL